MTRPIRLFLSVFALVLMFASPAFAAKGIAELKGTTEGSTVLGTVVFEDTAGGVHVTANISGVAAGTHGFHVHENGSCLDAGAGAGGHYNPEGVKHGNLASDGFTGAHAGDLGNIEAHQDGTATLDTVVPGLSVVGGKYSVDGHAVILHEKRDEFSQPTGNAGGRIGCGVIKVSG